MRSFKKVHWADVRLKIKDEELRAIIDGIAPGDDLSLYQVNYHYGDYILDQSELYVPSPAGELVPLLSDDIPKPLQEEFAYNYYSNPVTIVLEGAVELFTVFDNRIIPFYGLIPEGALFGTWFILSPQYWTMEPTFNWQMTAGARSIFMLPKIANKTKHDALNRELKMQIQPPETLADHFDIFKEIDKSGKSACNFELLYFGGKWFSNKDDPAFQRLYNHFLRRAWRDSDFWRNRFIEDMMVSFVQAHRSAPFDANALDRVRHILAICGGFHNGFAAIEDDKVAPVSLIKKIYRDIYDLKYEPTVIAQMRFDMNTTDMSFYSLNFENCQTFHPKPRGNVSLLKELSNIQYVYNKLVQILPKTVVKLEPSILKKIFAEIELKYIHADADGREAFITPETIGQMYQPFNCDPFPTNAPFLKGAVLIKRRDNE